MKSKKPIRGDLMASPGCSIGFNPDYYDIISGNVIAVNGSYVFIPNVDGKCRLIAPKKNEIILPKDLKDALLMKARQLSETN